MVLLCRGLNWGTGSAAAETWREIAVSSVCMAEALSAKFAGFAGFAAFPNAICTRTRGRFRGGLYKHITAQPTKQSPMPPARTGSLEAGKTGKAGKPDHDRISMK